MPRTQNAILILWAPHEPCQHSRSICNWRQTGSTCIAMQRHWVTFIWNCASICLKWWWHFSNLPLLIIMMSLMRIYFYLSFSISYVQQNNDNYCALIIHNNSLFEHVVPLGWWFTPHEPAQQPWQVTFQRTILELFPSRRQQKKRKN